MQIYTLQNISVQKQARERNLYVWLPYKARGVYAFST